MGCHCQGTKGSHNPQQHKSAKASFHAHFRRMNANLHHTPYDIAVNVEASEAQPQPTPPGKEKSQPKSRP
jgi:hypothetical protein